MPRRQPATRAAKEGINNEDEELSSLVTSSNLRSCAPCLSSFPPNSSTSSPVRSLLEQVAQGRAPPAPAPPRPRSFGTGAHGRRDGKRGGVEGGCFRRIGDGTGLAVPGQNKKQQHQQLQQQTHWGVLAEQQKVCWLLELSLSPSLPPSLPPFLPPSPPVPHCPPLALGFEDD